MLSYLSVFTKSMPYLKAHEEKSFVEWMKNTNNIFTGDEYYFRLGIWLSNKRRVEEHNRMTTQFRVALNHLSHLTPEEYRSMKGFNNNARRSFGLEAEPIKGFAAPESIDWRDKNVVNEICREFKEYTDSR